MRWNLFALDDVEHKFIEQGDDLEASKPNQRVVTKINLLVLNDVEHELKEQGNEMEATRPN
jgi:hypothetical protein